MTTRLIHKLKQRGYKQHNILQQIQDIKFNQRTENLYDKRTKLHTPRLMFTTKFNDDIPRIKQAVRKHWGLIKHNTQLNQIFPEPPTLAY